MGTEINWFEIHVLDLDRAEAFYKKIFNASFFEMIDYPCEARGITLNETPESMEGALVKHPSRRPSHEHGTILFFEVDDVDAKREQIKSLGGDDYGDLVTIDIAEAGRLTLIYMTDPEGNIVELQKWHGDSDA